MPASRVNAADRHQLRYPPFRPALGNGDCDPRLRTYRPVAGLDGEYCKSLFRVLLISLMLSWFSALTITPVLIKWWLFKGAASPAPAAETDPYRGRFYRSYQRILNALLRQNRHPRGDGCAAGWRSLGFGSVRQNFFPSSNTPIFFVDLWLPYGTDIAATEKMASDIETAINSQPGVVTTVATVGQGSMRFILTYSGQRQYSNYAQIMVRMDDRRSIDAPHSSRGCLYCALLSAGERQQQAGDVWSVRRQRNRGPD